VKAKISEVRIAEIEEKGKEEKEIEKEK